jgi:hypothetical protein
MIQSLALQQAVFQRLSGGACAGGAVFDAPPPGGAGGTYAVLGPEEVIDRGDVTGPGAEHRFAVIVVSDAGGFAPAKALAAQITQALTQVPLTLTEGRLVGLWFERARAERGRGGRGRRIELRFRARIDGAQ